MIGLTPFAWLIVGLASFRLTRLLNKDTIAGPVRSLGGRAGMKWIDFISCPWCVGAYVSAAVVVASLLWWHEVQYGVIVLAISAIVGLISERS